MKCVAVYIIITILSAVLICQLGCNSDDNIDTEELLTEQYFSDIEEETRQHL